MCNFLIRNPYHYFKRAVCKNALNIKTRESRKSLWFFFLGLVYAHFIVAIFAFALAFMIHPLINVAIIPTAAGAFATLMILPYIALFTAIVRRFHDVNHSGWLYVLLLIIVYLLIASYLLYQKPQILMTGIAFELIIIYFLIAPPTRGSNRYGERPEV